MQQENENSDKLTEQKLNAMGNQIIQIENNFAFPDKQIGLPADDSLEDQLEIPKLIASSESLDATIKLIEYK